MSMNTSHSGNVPVTLNDAVGTPVEIARKLLSVPATKVVVAALIIKGARGVGATYCTVRVKFCTPLGSVPLLAVIVIG